MRKVVEALVRIERSASQPQPARRVVKRLGAAGAHNSYVEEAQFYGSYSRLHAKLTAIRSSALAISVAACLVAVCRPGILGGPECRTGDRR